MALPPCLLGYGSDNDSYQVIGAGKLVWEQHQLVTSRLPGYWTFETAVYLLNRLGGPLLINLVSFAAGATILWRLDAFRRRIPSAAVTLASVLLVLTPVFQIAASSCDDYLWSMLALLLAFEAMLDERNWRAGGWSALATALRPTNAVVLAGLYFGVAAVRWRKRSKGSRAEAASSLRRHLPAAGISLLGLLPLVLSYYSFGHSFSFLHETRGTGEMYTWRMYAGRFGYKLLSLFGPLTLVVLMGACALRWRSLLHASSNRVIAGGCFGAIVADLLLFAKFPLEVSYLLPGALLLLLWMSFTVLRRNAVWSAALVLCFVFANAFTLVLAVPDAHDRASSARFTFQLERGPVLQDIAARRVLIGCDSLDCWRGRTGHQVSSGAKGK